MNIGVEARWLTRGPESGRSVLSCLIEPLIAAASARGHHLYIYVDRRDAAALQERFDSHSGVTVRPGWFGNRLVGVALLLGRAARRDRLDVLFTHAFIPLGSVPPTVLYVYDILYESHPQYFRLVERLYTRWVKHSCRRATRVLALSRFTKSQLVTYDYAPAEKIGVLYPGVPGRLEGGSHRLDRAVPRRYFLYAGRLNDRKNLGNLLAAAARVLREIPDLHLLLAGRRDGRFKDPTPLVAPDVAARIHFLGYVPDAILAHLYDAAVAVVYVPFVEGFGLPVLEAMSHGTPVIASRGSGLDEALGDGGLSVAADSPNEIADAMRRVAKDDVLRRKLAERGKAHAARFSWSVAAQKILDVCEQAASMPPRRG